MKDAYVISASNRIRANHLAEEAGIARKDFTYVSTAGLDLEGVRHELQGMRVPRNKRLGLFSEAEEDYLSKGIE